MENKSELTLTKTLAGAALLLAVVAWATSPRNVTPGAFIDQGTEFFPDFQDPNIATTLEVIEFDEETASARPFKVTNQGGIWTIPSHNNYPADGKDRLAQTAAGVIGITRDDFRSDNVADHEALGVLDPIDETITTLTGRGKRVTLRGENDVVLADFIVGKEIEGREGFRFVRIPGQKRVYAAKMDIDISTKFEDWIEKDLLQVTQANIDAVTLLDYSINERTLMVDTRDTVELMKADGTWSAARTPPNKEIDTTKMNSLLSAISGLSIVGVRPKPEGISDRLSGLRVDRSDMLSLQSKGYYMTREGDLLSNEGEVQIATNEGILYTLRFGEILYGRGEAISAGAGDTGDASTGPGENRYLFLTSEFVPELLSEPPLPANLEFEGKEDSELTDADRENKKLKEDHDAWQEKMTKGEELAGSLSERFAPWYYVISAESFDKIHVTRNDLLKDKET